MFAQLIAGAVHHIVDQFVGQFRRRQISPWQLQCRAKLRHEVAHTGITAGQSVGQERAHERPAQTGTKTDRIVNFASGCHAIVDQVQRLTPQRFKQAVSDETRHFLAHVQRAHTQGFVDFHRRLHGFWRGVFTADHFHQGQQVNRVERVTDHAAFRVGRALVELARQQAGRAGADQCIGLGRRADFAVQFQFQIKAFRSTFLDEVSIANAFFDGGDEAQTILRGTGCQALFFQCAPGIGDAFAQRGFGTGRRVPCHYVEAVGEGAGYPTAADDTAAQRGEGFDIGDKAHGDFLKSSMIRVGAAAGCDLLILFLEQHQKIAACGSSYRFFFDLNRAWSGPFLPDLQPGSGRGHRGG
ncbi:hypothetical protein D3C81_1297920 [compost metagenome]